MMKNEMTHNDPTTALVGMDVDVDVDMDTDIDVSNHSQVSTKSSRSKSPAKRKAKLWTWKKPKDKPKRPLSAYNIFFKHTRSRIVEGLSEEGTIEEVTASIEAIVAKSSMKTKRDRKKHGQISFKDLARTIAEKWKSLEEPAKSIFEHYAALDMKRYRKDVSVWKARKEADALANHSGANIISQTSFSSGGSLDDQCSLKEACDLEPSPMVDPQESHISMNGMVVSDSVFFSNDHMYNKKLEDAAMKNRELEVEVHKLKRIATDAIFMLKNKNANVNVSSNGNGNNPDSSSHNPNFLMVPFPAGPSLERMQQLHQLRLLKGDIMPPLGNNQNQQHEREAIKSSGSSNCEISKALEDPLQDPLDELDTANETDVDPVPFDDIFNGSWFNAFGF